MIKITNEATFGWEGAIRGMRNPYESHSKSDSETLSLWGDREIFFDGYAIGPNDMALAKKLIGGGSEHRKFLRFIHVQADVYAPRYWWAEMDKYKWVEANSSSTMHLITKRELTRADFSFEDVSFEVEENIIGALNDRIRHYNKISGKGLKDGLLREIKQLLPESFNQLRTIDTNYECLLSIYRQRKNHRLSEWREFADWIEDLPYMIEFLEAVK